MAAPTIMSMSMATPSAVLSMVTMASQTMAVMQTMMPELEPANGLPDPLEPIKQECGRRVVAKKYDLGLHVLGLILVLLMSTLGAGFPVLAKKIKWLRIPPRVFFFCKHFGTGVLIATAFVHLLPTAFISLTDPCLPDFFTERYPALAGVIGLTALFSLFAIEMWMHGKLPHAHSHGGITGEEFAGRMSTRHNPPGMSQAPEVRYSRGRMYGSTVFGSVSSDDEHLYKFGSTSTRKASTLSALEALTGADEAHIKTRDAQVAGREEITTLPSAALGPEFDVERYLATEAALTRAEQRESRSFGLVDLDPDTVDPAIYKKMAMEISLLEGGILFHSVFVGMTVSITVDGFLVLLIAILFHQAFEGLGLGARIAAVPYPRRSAKPWLLVLAFGTTAPIGQAIGLAAHGSYDPQSPFALILVGVFNSISSGLLIYAALVDLLQHDFLSEEADRLLTKSKKMLAFTYVLLGAAAMSFVGAFA